MTEHIIRKAKLLILFLKRDVKAVKFIFGLSYWFTVFVNFNLYVLFGLSKMKNELKLDSLIVLTCISVAFVMIYVSIKN